MKIINPLIALTFFLIACLLLLNCSLTQITEESQSNKPLLIYSNGDVYKRDWRVIDSLEQNGLTKSALEEVEQIYRKAEKADNHQQLLKSLLVKAKLQSYVEEESFVKTIRELTTEAANADYPLNPFLHSIIGEMYWKYYQRNRWKFQNRSVTVNFKNEDISTWDLKKIIEVTTNHYLQSIENIDSLKRTPIETFNELIIEENARKFRPFLYDFLAHRAVDFFMNEEPSITKPIYEFTLDKKEYIELAPEFSTIKIISEEDNSLKKYALQTLQNLTKTHLNNVDPEALIDVELKRIKFVKNNATFQGVDSLFYKSLADLYEKYKSHPSSTEIIYELANIHYGRGQQYDPLKSTDHQWELKKAREMCLAAIQEHPKSFGVSKCQYLANLITHKSLKVVAEKVNRPNVPLKAKITSKNLDKIYFRLHKIDFDDYNKWMLDRRTKEQFDKIRSTPAVRKWELDLQKEGDFQSHAGEFKIEPLTLGFYVLLAGTTQDFVYEKEAVATTPFWVSNLSYMSRKKEENQQEFFVLNRESGQPIKGVKAKLFYQKYNYTKRKQEWKSLGTKTTDQEGSFTVTDGNDYRNYHIDFSYENDRLSTKDYHYQNRNYQNENKKYTQTIFFTDRTIYRPGQTVYFKGIVIETDAERNNKILSNFKSTVTLYDVNRQKVASLKLTTNEYGTYSGSFVTPNTGLNGQMHITDGNGTKYFSVEEYKRPKFEVQFEPVKGSYKLGENVTATGKAMTYSGAALDEAEVNYRVVRNASFPYWCYYYWGYRPQSAEMEIKNGTTKTNNSGMFNIEFLAQADQSIKKQFSPTYSYTIYADVIDVNGETHSSTTKVNVGYNALKMNISVPEKVNKNKIDTFDFATVNLNGVKEPAQVNVKVWSLKTPNQYYKTPLLGQADRKYILKGTYLKDFPLSEYNEENNRYKWEKLKKVYDQNLNTAIKTSIQWVQLKKWTSGQYVLEATTTDKFGQAVKEMKYFTIYGEEDQRVPKNELGWFTKVKDKGEPGEKAIFLIGSAANNVNVLYEIEHKKKIIKRERILLKNGEQRKITIPIEERFRGNFHVHFTFVRHERKFTYSSSVQVPYTNKELDLEFETFRNKLLPGQQEEWKIKIKGKKGEKVAAEMVAGMYDASLDAFRSNLWGFDMLYHDWSSMYWEGNTSFNTVNSQLLSFDWNVYTNFTEKKYDHLNWFGYNGYRNYYGYGNTRMKSSSSPVFESSSAMDMAVLDDASSGNQFKKESEIAEAKANGIPANFGDVAGGVVSLEDEKGKDDEGKKDLSNVKTRKNFNETAFFYPHLATNSEGDVEIKFTIPEALTKWKFMGFAHTKDLKTGALYEETVTQKELMVFPNAPRFFRENDELVFSTKITNLSDNKLMGDAKIFFYDALTMKEIPNGILKGKTIIPFTAEKSKSTLVSWEISIPEGYSAITYKVVAKAGNFSDGEEMTIPVLTNRMLVTESMPLPIRGKQTKHFRFDKLVSNKSTTLKHHRLTLEYTSNPAWYAIQALPYLMEYPYECAEQTFSRFYANSIASHIANSSPKIAAVFESWKNTSPEAFLSNLEKNQELKALLLEETPWVLNAQNEQERKKRVGLLFDLNRMSNELGRAERKLQELQVSNGGWTWFKGMPESRYISQHIVTGMGHLDHLGVKKIRENAKTWNMIKKAVRYLDDRINDDYQWLKTHVVDLEKGHINYNQIQYLYARSYFQDLKIATKNQEAYDYYHRQAEKYWLKKSRYMQGMIALALKRTRLEKTGVHTEQKIIASLKENAINHEELGMYWKDNRGGYYWYQAPIETQALLIEAFDEVADDTESVEAMKVWLLKQKQTQDWKTTKATTEACYALLLRGTDLLASDQLVKIKVGNQQIDPKKMDDVKVEAGTGYFKTSWDKTTIQSNMGNVTVTKKDDGVAWGAMYWQYFEQLDKITPHETPLKLVKKLFLEKNTESGPVITPIEPGTSLKLGDKIKVRIELRVDRNMEYVHMKDMRAACLEPINVFSGYRYQDGLGYYETTKDASTNFFFDYLNKGTYVFEYPLRVNITGNFSNGISSIQCMYAPEFTSHSEGVRIRIGN